MDFAYSSRCKDFLARVGAFMEKYVYDGDENYERQHQAFGPGDGRWKVP
ncbi:MAG TPA: acyl-CoA dehydrogenase, partial [Parvularcula sp.]|nr:acyl-CoA dehydrogenase [Parvularcula sp.]